MNWIVVVVIIVIAVVSAIAQTIKNQQEKEQPVRRRNTNRANAGGVRTGTSDMDRFLQEIEKLRKRAAEGGEDPRKPAVKPAKSVRSVPTVVPVKKPRRNEPVPTVKPSRRIEQLPPATVLPPPSDSLESDQVRAIAESAPRLSDRPTVSRAPAKATTSAFGKELFGLLGNKSSLPMAVVLQEILGPPKSRKTP